MKKAECIPAGLVQTGHRDLTQEEWATVMAANKSAVEHFDKYRTDPGKAFIEGLFDAVHVEDPSV